MFDYEFDSYDIDISHIKNNDEVCWQYTTNSPIDEDDWLDTGAGVYYKLSPITQALALASDHVHLTTLKPSNIMEWYYRLDALFDAGVGFMFTDTNEGEVPIRLHITDLKDHLGLKIRTTNWDDAKFDRYIRQKRMQNHLRELL